jgi:hypothetical protein
MDTFCNGYGVKSIEVFGYFWLVGFDKINFVVFLCVYNMGKAIANLWMCMDSHFGFCVCVNVFFLSISHKVQWAQVQIPNKCLCMCIVWGLGQRFLKFAWVCVGLGGWEFVLCTWYDVNLLHETATMATWWSIHNQWTPPLKF